MKKNFILIIFATMSFFGYSQDWFGFNRYKADNERIIASGNYPEVVFMGNSITDNWAYFHPDFFSSHNFCGRGIGGQTSAQMLVRFNDDVIDLHPKAVVIMAGTNDVAHNEYWVSPERVVDNIVAENLGLPKTLSDDGCHPLPDTYFTMEEMVLEAISIALKK